MEASPHHSCVLGPRRVQLHLEILSKHMDSIEGADDRERELVKGWGTLGKSPQSPPPGNPRVWVGSQPPPLSISPGSSSGNQDYWPTAPSAF